MCIKTEHDGNIYMERSGVRMDLFLPGYQTDDIWVKQETTSSLPAYYSQL